MSNLDKITEALASLDSDNPVARELSALVNTGKSDAAIPLVDAAGNRMAEAFHALHEGKGTDEVAPLLKSASQLLLVACSALPADYRVMDRGEFETYAADEITKAGADGMPEEQLAALRVAIDVASVLFKNNDAGRFSIPLPLIAKAASEEEEEASGEDEGEKPETDVSADADAEKSDDKTADEVTAEAAPEASSEEGDAEVDEDAPTDEVPADADAAPSDDTEVVEKSASVEWPMDMNSAPAGAWGADGTEAVE